ncbi:MAG: acyltransferase family protein [Solobacterium sp.]|nr:acyltransferase family protein [Solobacterium sp.]
MNDSFARKRNGTIDLLRVMGLFLVISAHCGFSPWFTNARDFDVILLMFVSGISFALTCRTAETYADYVKKRFLRLILPVWVFLTIFFLFFRLIGRTFSPGEILQSYLLLAGGVLFVWVYRVFFTSALLNPFLIRIRDKADPMLLSLSALAVLLLNDLLSLRVFALIGGVGKVLQYLFTYTIAYGTVSFEGMVFERTGEKKRIALAALFAVSFLISGVFLKFPVFYDFKYPPALYYVSYGLAWSIALYLLFCRVSLAGMPGQVITWLSVHTMDIFMWHIFAFYLLDTLRPDLMNEPWLDLAVFTLGGILGAYGQQKISMLWKKGKKG